MNTKKLCGQINSLLFEADQYSYEALPQSDRGYPTGLPPEFRVWTQRTRNLIRSTFSEDSGPRLLVDKAMNNVGRIVGNGPDVFEYVKGHFVKALEEAKAGAEEDYWGELLAKSPGTRGLVDPKKVFIVHGHDHEAKNELELFLKEIGLDPVVLHRKVDEGQTLIEKFEKHSDVGYAMVLLTPDDVVIPSEGSETSDETKEHRARQNVIFEFGYFVGKLGRGRVCCLHKQKVALPSDLYGLIYKPFKEHIEEIKYTLVKELKAAGYEIVV